jgi:hypothetical protein
MTIEISYSIALGWSELVDINYVDEAALSLLKALCLRKLNVKEAVETVMQEIGPDPKNHSILNYYPSNMGEITLTNASISLNLKTLNRCVILIKRDFS